MVNERIEQHPLVYGHGILGFEGYTGDDKFCVFANADNNFLAYGITENSLLVVDTKLPFAPEKLNDFQTDKLVEGQKQLKLSLTKLGAFPYIGRVIMSVSQYS